MNKPTSSDENGYPTGPTQASLGWVIISALIVATLFTIWTEPDLLPASFSEALNSAMNASSENAENFPTPTPRQGTLIGIVAGHSGNDSGAVCPPELGGVREVDVNSAVAELVRTDLIAKGYNAVLMTEFDDRLNGFNGNALISIHADSCDFINDEATGFKVAAAVSSRYPEMATRLTNCLRARYAESTGMAFHAGSITADMSSYHAFDEIDPLTPAAIIETGFLNLDHEMLTKHQDVLAQGISNGILCFLQNETINPTP